MANITQKSRKAILWDEVKSLRAQLEDREAVIAQLTAQLDDGNLTKEAKDKMSKMWASSVGTTLPTEKQKKAFGENMLANVQLKYSRKHVVILRGIKVWASRPSRANPDGVYICQDDSSVDFVPYPVLAAAKPAIKAKLEQLYDGNIPKYEPKGSF